MRWRRRNLASMSADVGDGLAPAVEAVTSGEGRPPASTRSYRVIALVVASALFMQQLDGTVLTVALPTMARDLGTPATSLSLACPCCSPSSPSCDGSRCFARACTGSERSTCRAQARPLATAPSALDGRRRCRRQSGRSCIPR